MLAKRRKRMGLIILIMLFVLQACGRNIVATPESIVTATQSVPLTTETLPPKPSVTTTVPPNDVATANVIASASIGTIVSTVQPTVIATYPSQDGNWRVEIIRYDCSYVNRSYNEKIAYEQLKLINLRDGTEKIVADQRQICEGLGAFGLNGLYWSPNHRYFYYNESREGYPDGGCGNYIPLIYRLDSVNQEVIPLEGGFISPDKTKLALWQGREIAIWDLDKSEIARVTTLNPDLIHGRIWWSKAGTSILYLQTDSECLPGSGRFQLVRLDLTKLSQDLIARYEFTSTGIISAPEPAGVFVFYFYSPLIMNYDPSRWEVKEGHLRAKDLESCTITEQGPIDFNGPHSENSRRLGKIDYKVIGFPDSTTDAISRTYIAHKSLATDIGLPVFLVSAKQNEWNKCQLLAEEVLATLHFPVQ